MREFTKGEDYIVFSLPTIITSQMEKNWNKTQLGKTLGVTPLQVLYYKTGKTKTPSPKVCLSIFRNLTIDGKACLVDIYSSYEELVDHAKVAGEYSEPTKVSETI